MSGKLCTHNSERLSRAYCEGREAAAQGLDLEPPMPDGLDADSWTEGYNSWEEDPTGVPRDCCASAFGGGYTP